MEEQNNTTQPEQTKKSSKIVNIIVDVFLVVAIVFGVFSAFTA